MMPSRINGADLSYLTELFAIAVYMEDGNVTFKKLPGMGDLTTAQVNDLVIKTLPRPLQIQKILNITTSKLQKTSSEVTSSVNYTPSNTSKIISETGESDLSAYSYDPVYRNNQRFDSNGAAMTVKSSISDFADISTSAEYIETFSVPNSTVNGVTVYKVFDKYKNRIQIKFTDDIIKANDVIMVNTTTPYYIPITITDNTNTRTDSIPVFQRDKNGDLPTTFFDRFGNTVVAIENDMLKVKRTKIPILISQSGNPVMIDVKKDNNENKRLIDVIA
jgi:hypothetical protein